MIEGGNFHCYKDGFETDNIEEWNDHCSAVGEDGNTHIMDEGTTSCISCGDLIQFQIPYQPKAPNGAKNIQLRCDECEDRLTKGRVVKKV